MTSSSPHRVVAGVDGSEAAMRAGAWAAAEAGSRGLPLRLVCAWDESAFATGMIPPIAYEEFRQTRREAARQVLADAQARLARDHPGLAISSEAVANLPAEALVAASDSADLVVVGTRGLGGFAGLLLGSVGLELAAHTRCPTVVVRGGSSYDDGRDEIVLAVDSDEPEPPVTFAFAAANRMNTRLRAVHGHTPFGDYGDTEFPVDSGALDALVKSAREVYPRVSVTIDVRHGQMAKEILAAAQGARMLVAGSHRRHGPLSLGVGMTLHSLLHHAPCPLAVVPVD